MDVAALRVEIKSWEREFKAKHGRDPSIQEIKDQPAIGTFSSSHPVLPRSPRVQPQSTNSTSPSLRPFLPVRIPLRAPLHPRPRRHVNPRRPHPSCQRLEPSRSILLLLLPIPSRLSRTGRSCQMINLHHNVHLIHPARTLSQLPVRRRPNPMSPAVPPPRTRFRQYRPWLWFSARLQLPSPILLSHAHVNASAVNPYHLLRSKRSVHAWRLKLRSPLIATLLSTAPTPPTEMRWLRIKMTLSSPTRL